MVPPRTRHHANDQGTTTPASRREGPAFSHTHNIDPAAGGREAPRDTSAGSLGDASQHPHPQQLITHTHTHNHSDRAPGGLPISGSASRQHAPNPTTTTKTTDANHVALRIACVSAGSGGWATTGPAIIAMLSNMRVECDVAIVCETHLRFGDAMPIKTPTTHSQDDNHFSDTPTFSPIPHCRHDPRSHSKAGGVGVLVNAGASSRIHSISLDRDRSSRRADVAWYRIQLDNSDDPIFLAAVYLPPAHAETICPHDTTCTEGDCTLAHPAAAIAMMERTAADLSRLGHVVLAGDWNAAVLHPKLPRPSAGAHNQHPLQWTYAPTVTTSTHALPRSRLIQRTFFDHPVGTPAPFILANSCDHTRVIQPTRLDPVHHTSSVLDLVIVSSNNGARVTSFSTHPDEAVSDHFPLTVTITVPSTSTVAEEGHPATHASAPQDRRSPQHCRRRATMHAFELRHHCRLDIRVPKRTSQMADEKRHAFVHSVANWYRDRTTNSSELHHNIPPAEDQINAMVDAAARCGLIWSQRAPRHQREALDTHHLRDTSTVTVVAPAQTFDSSALQRQLRHCNRAVRDTLKRIHAEGPSDHLNEVLTMRRQALHQARLQYRPIAKEWRRHARTQHVMRRAAAARYGDFRAAAAVIASITTTTTTVHRQRQQRRPRHATPDKKTQRHDEDQSTSRTPSAAGTAPPSQQHGGRLNRRLDRSNIRRPVRRTKTNRAGLDVWHASLIARFQPADCPPIPSQPSSERHSGLPHPPSQDLLDATISIDDVREAVSRLRGSAAGTGVPIEALKLLAEDDDIATAWAHYLDEVFHGSIELPTQFTTTVVTPILKKHMDPRDVNSYRPISFGDTMSRVLQSIVMRRLLLYIRQHSVLHHAQCGFIMDNNVLFATWLSDLVVERCARQGSPVHCLFLDLKAAFDSIHHADILNGLARVGITGTMWHFISQFLSQLQLTMFDKELALTLIQMKVGVPQGVIFSPVLWDITLDPLLRRIDAVCSTPGAEAAVPMVAGQPTPTIFYCDDGRFMVLQMSKLEDIAACVHQFAEEHRLTINMQPSKTACMPMHGSKEVADTVIMGDTRVPVTDSYRHLGITVTNRSRPQSHRTHAAGAYEKLKAAIGQCHGSGIRSAAVEIGRLALLTRVRPATMFGLAIWATPEPVGKDKSGGDGILSSITQLDWAFQRVILHSAQLPRIVIHSLMGARTVRAEAVHARMHLLLQLLTLPDQHFHRRALVELVRDWHSDQFSAQQRAGMWWHGTVEILKSFDLLHRSRPAWIVGTHWYADVHEPQNRVNWVDDVLFALDTANHAGARLNKLAALHRLAPYMVEYEDYSWRCLQLHLGGVQSSLRDTATLMDNPLIFMPFLHKHRSKHATLRVHLRAGSRYLFRGHRTQDGSLDLAHEPCPWCAQPDALTVPHLLRDCSHWASLRQQIRVEVVEAVRPHGLMATDTNTAHSVDHDPIQADLWYRLAAGATVPACFFNTGSLFKPRAIGGASPAPNKEVAHVYAHVMSITGRLLTEVIGDTQRRFGIDSHWKD